MLEMPEIPDRMDTHTTTPTDTSTTISTTMRSQRPLIAAERASASDARQLNAGTAPRLT
jgi:hypothetical protein